MALLYLEPLPARLTKGELLAFLCATGSIDGKKIGRIELRGATAVVEIPDGCEAKMVKALDGASLKHRRLRAWSGGGPVIESDHFQRLARLLDLEAQAEEEQGRARLERLAPAEAERLGDCLVDLVIADVSSGLGGRWLLTVVKRNRTASLPWTRLQVGAPVLVTPESAQPSPGCRGVVCERNDKVLRVAVAEPPDDAEATTYRVTLSSDEVARQRQRAALERARTATRERLADLRAVLLGETAPAFGVPAPYTPLDPSLNASQQEAVRFALSAHDLAIIHGPPGTGKTTTVVELIRQAVRRGHKVLACAPSNLAVDNVLERLVAAGEQAVRLGHPARVLPALRQHTLDLLVEEHSDLRLARKFSKEAFARFRKAGKWTRARPEPGARQDMRREARDLLAEARRLEAQAVERILDGAAVLCATTTALDSEILGQRRFELAVIDEAAQSTEPGCWIPLTRCDRLILAGDHCQLPPTVLSSEAAAADFGLSLQERLVARYGTDVTRRLTVQYRMHEAIMAFSSLEFYDAELVAASSVRGHRLCDLPDARVNAITEQPLHFLDTAGAGFEEHREPDGESLLNPEEARLVCQQVTQLLDAGIKPGDIAVIAPYSAQVRLLRQQLSVAGLEIDSVDGFQGREKEAVVISLVRSNSEGEIGFLADVRRMNVALTRARRKLIVVGDSATLSNEPFYQRLIRYFESVDAYHTVWEEPELS
ncbi:MAG TPA: AAA domain-containing protein [Gemmataceae bacterium]|nr:AAA domain-containing protein [Gemmataceae bacterium]